MSALKEKWYRDKLAKKVAKGFRGYPLATVAFYGPDAVRATKVSVGIVAEEDAEPDPLQRWFSEERDVRNSAEILEAVIKFIEFQGAKSVASLERILGCPHEEGIDYPEGEKCPRCAYWASHDRWGGDQAP
jgi:hypothetical protein